MRRNPSSGQFLVGGIAFLAAVMIVCQAMVFWTQRETAWTVTSNDNNTAFNLAEAGYNRALWKLKESRANFDSILLSTPIPGYNNDVVYSDVAGGTYKIQLSSEPSGERIDILATGKADKGRSYSAILAVVDRGGEDGAVTSAAAYADNLSLFGTLLVHWGPINTTKDLDLKGWGDQLYPRKMSRQAIRASGSYGNRDTAAGGINTDNVEWWSYNSGPGVPSSPSVDLNYYKNLAQAQGNYYNPVTTLNNLVNTDPTRVYYFKNNATLTGTMHFRGTIIAEKQLTFNGTAKSPEGNLTVWPSTGVYVEYSKNTPAKGSGSGSCSSGGPNAADDGNYTNLSSADGDSDCVDQYPGDNGYHATEGYTIGTGCVNHGSLSGASGRAAVFSGFIYAGGDFHAAKPVTIYGALQVQGAGISVDNGGGALELFYNPGIQIQTTSQSGTTFSLTSWMTVSPTPY